MLEQERDSALLAGLSGDNQGGALASGFFIDGDTGGEEATTVAVFPVSAALMISL